MLASFRRTFKPTDEERAEDRRRLEELHAQAVAERDCCACVFSHTKSNGHYSWLECEVTGEDVTYETNRECWTEQELPEEATL